MKHAHLLAMLKTYVDRFNSSDEELYPQAISNQDAYDYLSRQIPLFECPDPQLMETYYFRWWTFRKHWKLTSKGHIVTEFLPPVKWAGSYNSINCASGLHIREGRWLADPEQWLQEYILFWLCHDGDPLSYSGWLAAAVEEYCRLRGDDAFAAACLSPLIALYRERESQSQHESGLLWSIDDRDAMEFSISGSGLRPTLNSYMYGDAMAIARMAAKYGRMDVSIEFQQKAETLQALVEELLWDGDFYKVLPCGRNEPVSPSSRQAVPDANNVRELIGYIPWYFNLPGQGRAASFAQLLDPQGFAADYGLTTAEQRHPRFMFTAKHECLWNGPTWPFATSQTLVALASTLRKDPQTPLTWQDYFALLRQYAVSHQRIREDGTRLPWIDENMNPFTGEWTARAILKQNGWDSASGGYERGKDYNHSMFCDHILSGLMGIGVNGSGTLTADPMLPESWSYARVSRVPCRGKTYTVLFDRTGQHYGMGKGVHILEDEPD